MLWLKKRNPGLLKERMSNRPDAKQWDKIVVQSLTAFLLDIFICLAILLFLGSLWALIPAGIARAAWEEFTGRRRIRRNLRRGLYRL
jgi:hypothetical protein